LKQIFENATSPYKHSTLKTASRRHTHSEAQPFDDVPTEKLHISILFDVFLKNLHSCSRKATRGKALISKEKNASVMSLYP